VSAIRHVVQVMSISLDALFVAIEVLVLVAREHRVLSSRIALEHA
jgi:hypothetical protein